MAILVTGGAGFIGSHFIEQWFKQSNEVLVNVDKLTYAANATFLESFKNNPNYHFVHADVNDQSVTSSCLSQYQIRAIFHFAAESHVDRSISSPEIFLDTNVLGTVRLLEVAKNFWNTLSGQARRSFRFVQVSTDEVYGSLRPDASAFTENHRIEPNSPYSASKAAADHFVRAYFHTYGLPVLTSNCSNNYGPRQHNEKLIPHCISNALSGKSIPIYGDGQQIRDWLFVTDHCAALREIMENGRLGEVYNVGGWNEQANVTVVNMICELLDELCPKENKKSYKEQIRFVNDRPGHDRRYAIDAEKIHAELGWKPLETFSSGLKQTVEWYVDNFKKQAKKIELDLTA